MNRLSRCGRRSGALALVSMLAFHGCGDTTQEAAAPPPVEVGVTEVVVRDVPIVREWVGETRGRADIEIRARVRGFLDGIHFIEGGRVKKGQLLYSIDQSELLQEVSARTAEVAAAKTELAYAEADERRYRPLAEINAVSQRDLDSAVANREAAEARVEASEALLKLAEINLSYSRIKAPMDGLIGLTNAKIGDYVGQSPNPVVLNTVSDIDPIHVRFPIGEREYLELARRYPPQAAGATSLKPKSQRLPLALTLADGTVHSEDGYALFVERNVDASTGTLTVEAEFPNPGGVIRPGQYGRVRAVIDTLPGAHLIPQRAVQELQGRHRVWVVEQGGTATLKNVKMGRRVDQMWVVNEGLAPGDKVVVEGIQRLRAGARVVPKPWEPPPPPEGAVAGG